MTSDEFTATVTHPGVKKKNNHKYKCFLIKKNVFKLLRKCFWDFVYYEKNQLQSLISRAKHKLNNLAEGLHAEGILGFYLKKIQNSGGWQHL